MLAKHWDAVYRSRDVHTVSWYQPVPERSLELLGRVTAPTDGIVDVGAGASTPRRPSPSLAATET